MNTCSIIVELCNFYRKKEGSNEAMEQRGSAPPPLPDSDQPKMSTGSMKEAPAEAPAAEEAASDGAEGSDPQTQTDLEMANQ